MEKYGSLDNLLGVRTSNKSIEIGEGATIYWWTDRTACTVIEVSKSGKFAKIQEDKAIEETPMSNNYKYEKDTKGRIFEIYCRKGIWKTKEEKQKVIIGKRDKYYDYSF